MRTYLRPAKLQSRLKPGDETPQTEQKVEKPPAAKTPDATQSARVQPGTAPQPIDVKAPLPANDSSHQPKRAAPPPPLPKEVSQATDTINGSPPVSDKPAHRAPSPVVTPQPSSARKDSVVVPEVPAAEQKVKTEQPPSLPVDSPAMDSSQLTETKKKAGKKPGLAVRLFGRRKKILATSHQDGRQDGSDKQPSGRRETYDQQARASLPPIDTNVEPLQPRPAKVTPQPRLILENVGLEIRSLGKHFKKRPVLRDVSLRVQRGEAVGLLGPNGAGKTTCFYIVTGLIPADYGEIFLDGQDITSLPMYRRARMGIGYLPQEASIFRGLTVEQNIRAVLELVEKDLERRETALESLLAEFSISHLRRTPAIALSGGERRRLEIARALASQPNFILLDEPLAGIDPIAVRDIRDLVSHLKDRGIGVLITDHNVRETLEIVDRAYILHDGNVLMEGPPAEIVANQEVRRVYLGDRFTL